MFPLASGAREGSKTAFFLPDEQVTTPACLLVQPGVLLFLFMALRSEFLGEFGILRVAYCPGW